MVLGRPAALACLVFAAAVLFSPGAVAADSTAGEPIPGDLICPSPPVASIRSPDVADRGQMPTVAELGPLADPVVRPQPVIDPSSIPGFVLDGASAAAPRRIAVWGDSHVAAGAFMPTVMAQLQTQAISKAFLL